MKVVPRLLCVLAPLIVTGHALMCTSCVSLNACEPDCTSDSTVQCSSSELCSTAYRQKTQNGKITYDIIRACAPKDKCDKVGAVSSSNITMTMGIGCCSTDSCAPTLPQLTQERSASNNVYCGSCSSSQSTVCQTTGNMSCTGQETRCVIYSQTISDEASVYQGCGTPSLCDIQHYNTKAFGVTAEHSFTCPITGAASGVLAPGFILTALICVILMNRSM